MKNLGIIFRRELSSYFATPLAYIFVVIFLIINGIFTFDLGGFYPVSYTHLTLPTICSV